MNREPRELKRSRDGAHGVARPTTTPNQRVAGPHYEDKDFDTNYTNERELGKCVKNML